MYATLLALALAVPTDAPAADDDHHAAARLTEAHRLLQAEHVKARTAASELYNYASYRIGVEREIAQRMVVDISQAVESGTARFDEMRNALTPGQRKDAATELQLITDWHGKAAAGVAGLKDEVAKATPNGREIRFHSSAVYTALDGAHQAHDRLLNRLGIQVSDRTPVPAH